jgi:hypothetical protein
MSTSSSPVKLKAGSTQEIVIDASDPDGDPLTYIWGTDYGAVTGSGNTASFTAPDGACTAITNLDIGDGKGHTVSVKCYFSVYKDNQKPPEPDTNAPPTITSLVAEPDAVRAWSKSTITAAATDVDEDSLTYTWTTSDGGFQSQSGNVAVWLAPHTARISTVTVAVSDGKNPAVTKSIVIPVVE